MSVTKLWRSNVFVFWAAIAMASLAFSSVACAGGFDLTRLSSPLTLNAIPKADNGKAVGMKVTLTKDTLTYKSVKGAFQLEAPSRFDLSKMATAYQTVYKNADGAYVYPIRNWSEIEASNSSNIHFSGDQAARFIYIYRAKYAPTGQTGIFVCTISNPDLAAFYTTAAGHGRCDVFKDK